ncbi:MAG: DUF86 domain-containing protein [Deltaproteobacteria bacterium]|nr:DUF86 domain-containing protein [Deltaproteobacteria bacterium]
MYKGILKELGGTQYFDETFGDEISQWASIRNILAHEYLNIRWDSLKEFIRDSEPIYKKLTDVTKALLLSQKGG